MWRYHLPVHLVGGIHIDCIPRAMVVDLGPLGSSVTVASFVVKSWTAIGRDYATRRSILFSFDNHDDHTLGPSGALSNRCYLKAQLQGPAAFRGLIIARESARKR